MQYILNIPLMQVSNRQHNKIILTTTTTTTTIIIVMTEELSVDVAATSPASKMKKKETKESKSAEKKKNKKRKSTSDDVNVDAENDDEDDQSIEADADADKYVSKAGGKSRLQSKKEEKEELLKKVPTKDKDGMAYTKLQIRRMMKRVKKGLPPVPTPRELEESKQAEARLKREEESLYAGEATHNEVQNDSDDDDDDAEEEGEDDDGDDEGMDGNNNVPPEDKNTSTPVPTGNDDGKIAKKKAKRNKTVPSDYVCSACKNRNTPAHWIYDCPDKITVRGANQKKKKDRGVHDPDSKKVFVSGLPFEANAKKVEDFFSTTHNCGIVSCVGLIKFDDSKRCNGQAYVTFNTDEGAKLALELTGITINAEELSSDVNDAKKKKKNGKEGEGSSDDVIVKRKELKLKVSKVRNRNETKPQVRSYNNRK